MAASGKYETPSKGYAARLRRLLNDEDYGPKLVRLSAADQQQVLQLVNQNKGREARATINRLDEQRRGIQLVKTNVYRRRITAKRLNGELPADGLTTQWVERPDKRSAFYTWNAQIRFRVEGSTDWHYSSVYASNIAPITDDVLVRNWRTDQSHSGSDPDHESAVEAVVMLYGKESR